MTYHFTPNHFDQFADLYIELKAKISQESNPSEKRKLQAQQLDVLNQMKILVLYRSSKYMSYSNGLDLKQEGMEGLLMALDSYQNNRSAFSWWADKYISTRIKRALGNSHFIVKIPHDKVKQIMKETEGPAKYRAVIDLESILDFNDPETLLMEKEESEVLTVAISELDAQDKLLLETNLKTSGTTLTELSSALGVSKPTLIHKVKKIKQKLKNQLNPA